ncbi:MAG TPA: outer membrane beta-barrel protein, partial [Terracidiphilus sp.]
FSRFNMAFPPGSGKNYEQGATVWADWTKIPLIPRNFGLEGEYRRLSFNPPPSNPGLRSNVFLGGPTYTWNFSRLSIYGKGMFGYGAIHFSGYEPYTNDSRTLTAVGGGAQYRITSGVLLRADYEYQWWPALITGRFQPNGLTIGLAYDFRTVGRRY